MNSGKYIFNQLVDFLPKRIFDGIVKKYSGDRYVKTFTCWNQLLVMMFGQLSSCDSLREVICIISAIKLSNVAYANANRDYRIFEEFAYYMINLAQSKRLDREFIRCPAMYPVATRMMATTKPPPFQSGPESNATAGSGRMA